MDSKERKDNHKGKFRDDTKSDCIAWKKKLHIVIHPILRT